MEETTLLEHEEIGVNIWLVRGPRGFRRLVRAAKVVAEDRHETPITWTKGKGIIGEAWDRNQTRFADLDTVRADFPTEAQWCSLKREDRFRLSWAEFMETSRYHAVLAVPLRRHRFSRHLVRGVVAIDVLVPGKASQLDGLQVTREFSSISSASAKLLSSATSDNELHKGYGRVRRCGGGMSGNNGDPTNEENVRKMREAVRDVQDPERGPITWETVKTLREAGLDDLADIAETYVVPAARAS